MSLVAPVNNGQLEISESSQQTEKKTGSALDKDDFLMLLVTQMKYQDPLEPESNTEYVSQLAQFSELEQMENLNSTTINTSAYSLVGKQVYIEESSETGADSEVQGMVEYVTLQNGEPYVSVNGELYKYDDIVQVIDDVYLVSTYLPSVEQQSLLYMHWDAQDVEIKGIDMGSNGYQATSMAIVLMAEDGTTQAVPTEWLTYEKGTLTISKNAFSTLTAGNYVVAFVFDDASSTVDYSSVTLTVKGSPAYIDHSGDTVPSENPEDTSEDENVTGN